MKIVIIASVFYPRMSPRSLRTTELAKELSRQGHDVTVYALLGNYDYNKYSSKTGIKIKQLGISKWGAKNSDGVSHANIFRKIIVKYFGKRLWLPDCELIPMVKKAVSQEKNVDCLITIAVPHSINYAASLSDLSEVKCWIADCGDPFTLNPFGKYPAAFVEYEKQWCSMCDFITVPIKEALEGYYPEFHDKIRVIPQGFNFQDVHLAEYEPNSVPTFAYIGAVHKRLRDPSAFLNYLTTLKENFRFIIYGNSWSFFQPFKTKLGEKLVYGGRIPHDELIMKISSIDFLINIKNPSSIQQPSKLIDYALSQRPFMSISSDFDEKEKKVFLEFMKGDYSNKETFKNLDDYNISNVAKRFIDLAKSKIKI